MYYWTDNTGKVWMPILQNQQNSVYNIQTLSHAQNQRLREVEDRISKLQIENQQLKKQLSSLKTRKSSNPGRKIKRRQQNQLNKNIVCPFTDCSKQYASDLALNLHIKLKHNGGSKKQRENIAKKVIQARIKGLQQPIHQINFPPGYLEQVKSKINKTNNLKHSKKS